MGAALVVATGKWLAWRAAEHEVERPVVDLANAADQHASPMGAARPRVLLAADDSPASLRGVGRFVEQMPWYREPLAVDLVNVQAPVHRDVSTFVDEATIKGLHHEQGKKALQPARELLEKAGVPCIVHIGVGDFSHVVAHYARSLDSRQIFLSDTARLQAAAPGTDVADLCEHAPVPVVMLR